MIIIKIFPYAAWLNELVFYIDNNMFLVNYDNNINIVILIRLWSIAIASVLNTWI